MFKIGNQVQEKLSAAIGTIIEENYPQLGFSKVCWSAGCTSSIHNFFLRRISVIPDWRSNLTQVDSLYDLDPAQTLVAFRHMYLETCKDELRQNKLDLTENNIMVVLLLQEAIELQLSEEALHTTFDHPGGDGGS